ncbi:MAG TPA: hypothetical protein VK211_01545 [Kamptonema sp.]|nr:hypothetical protein [Kamptonema sp.]
MTNKKEEFNDFKEPTTESKILEKISALAKQIELDFSGAKTTLECFYSGAAMLDIHLNDRLFVMAYFPAHGFGVDEVGEEDGFNTGYNFNTPDFYLATKKLNQLIKSAPT